MLGMAPTSWDQGRQSRVKARSTEVRGPRERQGGQGQRPREQEAHPLPAPTRMSGRRCLCSHSEAPKPGVSALLPCRVPMLPLRTHRAQGESLGVPTCSHRSWASCPQVPEWFGELSPRILELVPCGPFLYPGPFPFPPCPTSCLYTFMHGAPDGPLLMDNLEPPPTHPVPAPLLGSWPPASPLPRSTVTSPVGFAHTGFQPDRPPNLCSL